MNSAKKINIPVIKNKPVLDICLFRNLESVDISFEDNNYTIADSKGIININKIEKKRSWRIKLKLSNPAVYKYYSILCQSNNSEYIKKEYEKLSDVSDYLSIVETGGSVLCFENMITDNKINILLAGPFASEKEARDFCKKINYPNHCPIHRKLEKNGTGIIEVFDTDDDFYAEVHDYLKLIPLDYTKYLEIKNFKIPLCGETEKTIRENLFYQGGLHIRIDENFTLAGANQIPLNLYLKGVLSSEVGEHDSQEFIKTMAIVARSYVFANYKLKHFNEPIDFCSSGHCLRYYGVRPVSSNIDDAIMQTEGLMLQNNGHVNPAPFSYSCGGHTDVMEHNGNVSGINNTKPKFDCHNPTEFKLKLNNEIDVKEWILNQPEVYCRETTEDSIIAPRLSTNSFRWEVFYTRQELEKILSEKTGQDPGIIFEIIPISRSSSGRIRELEILGSLRNVRIQGELNIRLALSETILQSTCFIVKSELGDDSVPLNFTIIGAGNGHGVGLCKVGAAKLAENNHTMEHILNHYFQESSIQKKY